MPIVCLKDEKNFDSLESDYSLWFLYYEYYFAIYSNLDLNPNINLRSVMLKKLIRILNFNVSRCILNLNLSG